MNRLKPLPASLQNPENHGVLAFLQGKSAHSDIVEVLAEAAEPLGDVEWYSSDPANYGYVVLATRDVVFAAAYGMSRIGLRLDETFRARALETGGYDAAEIGPGWVAFEFFRSNYPAIDLPFWVRKAYLVARGADPT